MLTSLALSSTQRAFLNQASLAYHQQLDEQTVSYLVARGVDQAAATGLRLGRCLDPLPGHEQFRDMLSLPYVTPKGVVSIKFRCMCGEDCKTQGHPKYNQPSGQQQRLYNVNSLHHDSRHIGIAEGEFSAGILDHMVGIPTVGTPGTGAWLDHWPRVFADYERIFVFADNDMRPDGSNPGLRHAEKIAKSLSPAAMVIKPPDGLDPDEWYLKEGPETIRGACGLD